MTSCGWVIGVVVLKIASRVMWEEHPSMPVYIPHTQQSPVTPPCRHLFLVTASETSETSRRSGAFRPGGLVNSQGPLCDSAMRLCPLTSSYSPFSLRALRPHSLESFAVFLRLRSNAVIRIVYGARPHVASHYLTAHPRCRRETGGRTRGSGRDHRSILTGGNGRDCERVSG